MTRLQLARRGLQALPLAVLCLWASLPAAESTRHSDSSAAIIRYEAPNGGAFYALSLRAASKDDVRASRDHVVLVDTSASQAGAHRTQQLAVVEAFAPATPPP